MKSMLYNMLLFITLLALSLVGCTASSDDDDNDDNGTEISCSDYETEADCLAVDECEWVTDAPAKVYANQSTTASDDDDDDAAEGTCQEIVADDDDDDDTVLDDDDDDDTTGEFGASLMDLFGTEDQDTVAGAVFDAAGNSYIVGISKGMIDLFNSSIFWAKLTPTGEVDWIYDLGHSNNSDDGIRVIGDTLEGNGSSRMVAKDGDGNLYIAGRGKGYKASSFYGSYALKIDPATGAADWANVFKREWTSGSDLARAGTEGSGVVVVDDKAYVTGWTYGEAQVLLYSLATSDGALVDSISLDPSPTYNDRAYSLVADETNKKLYLVGWEGQNNRPLIVKVDISTDDLTIDWFERLDVDDWDGGTQASDIDIDDSGNIYVSFWIAGAAKWYEVAKFTPDGAAVWGRRYNVSGALGTADGSVKNDCMIVRVIDGKVYVGGRVGVGHVTWGDTSLGDSGLVVYDLDGNFLADRYYFTGTDNTKTTLDHIKAIDVIDGKIYLAGTIWPKASNFLGEWLTPEEITEALTPVEIGQMELLGSDYTVVKTDSGFVLDDLPLGGTKPIDDASFDRNFLIRDQSAVTTTADAETRVPSSDDPYVAVLENMLP